MLYLAEIKKQRKGFLPGTFKTELKLLAWQHNDQTWSAVQGEEIVASDAVPQLGEGALLMVNLTPNRQIEEKPELAGPELVRQLQKLSRLSEKLKDQQEEIEQWKQSLTYQSEELARRSMEVEAQLEQCQQMGRQIENLEEQRREIEEGWASLREERQQMEENPLKIEGTSHLTTQQAQGIQQLLDKLSADPGGVDSLVRQLHLALEMVNSHQLALDGYWQQLEQGQSQLEHYQQEVGRQEEAFAIQQQELQSAQIALQQLKSQLHTEQGILSSKQELWQRLEQDWQSLEELQRTVGGLGIGTGDGPQLDQKVDLETLEEMPLGELQEKVNQLQRDLDQLVQFVNDQEEELSLQSQAVEELEEQLTSASEYDHLRIEEELAEEQERKRMLDKTLVGQRRNLRERQGILLQHLRILRRRQGVVELDESQGINLEPVFQQLAQWQTHLREERQRLETEIEYFQQNLQQVREVIEKQEAEQIHKAEELRIQEENWQQAKQNLTQWQIHLSLYQGILQPLQDSLNGIRQSLQTLNQWF